MKVTKTAAHYGKGMKQEHCSLCTHYRSGTCTIVQGAIAPNMWCDYFNKKDTNGQEKRKPT